MMLGCGMGLNTCRCPIASQPAGFTPAALFASGEQGAWYDPSDISTLFQDAAGTTSVTASGQRVGRMLDKSGRSNHATQSVDTKRPTYVSTGGNPRLTFDNVDDEMNFDLQLNGGTWDVGATYTPSGFNFILITSYTADSPWFGIGQASSASPLLSSGGGQGAAYFNNNLSSEISRGEQYNRAAESTRMLFNFTPSESFSTLAFGQYHNTVSLGAPGPIYGYVLRAGTMDATQRADLDAYFAAKVG